MRGAGGFTQDLDGISSGTSGSESGTPSPSEADREKQQRDGGQARRGVPSPRPRSPPEGTLASQAGFVIAGQRKDPAHSPTQGLGGLSEGWGRGVTVGGALGCSIVQEGSLEAFRAGGHVRWQRGERELLEVAGSRQQR